jgi:hypothetical protein
MHHLRTDEFSIKVTSPDKALRLTVDYVIVYVADMAARFGHVYLSILIYKYMQFIS